MGTEITLRKRAIKLWLQGLSKCAIARRLGKPRLWVQRWIQRYDPSVGKASLQDHSSVPKHLRKKYPEKVKEAVLRSRQEREERKDPKYKHALVGADAIYHELQELGVTPLPPSRTIHAWLNMAEIELSVLARQCLDGRIPSQTILVSETETWATERNMNGATVDWHFTTNDARIKLKKLYPSIHV